jgi:hypothetical protein
LLAEFAAPQRKFSPARELDGLEDDVATLTYEHALRAHARFPAPADAPLPLADRLPDPALPAAPALTETRKFFSSPASPVQLPGCRKNAMVSVRLTAEENAQLHVRAAEAGLTLSAYLRSCAFEVETLRSQVKQTIAELRGVNSVPERQSGWRRMLPWRRKTG